MYLIRNLKDKPSFLLQYFGDRFFNDSSHNLFNVPKESQPCVPSWLCVSPFFRGSRGVQLLRFERPAPDCETCRILFLRRNCNRFLSFHRSRAPDSARKFIGGFLLLAMNVFFF